MSRTYPARPTPVVVARLVLAFAALYAGTWLVGWVLLRSGWVDVLPRWDRDVAEWVSGHRTPWVTSLARLWTRLGTREVIPTIDVLAGLALWRWRRTWLPLAQLLGTYALLPVVYSNVKQSLERPRPRFPPIVATEHSWAFPSGHSAQGAALFLLLGWWVLGGTTSAWARRAIAATATVLALGVLWSRVELGVHWTTDVLVGGLLGVAWALALLRISGSSSPSSRAVSER